jgi:hypothetical protein
MGSFLRTYFPGRKVTPPPKSVFHSCIWASVDLTNANELLSVSRNHLKYEHFGIMCFDRILVVNFPSKIATPLSAGFDIKSFLVKFEDI